MLKQSGDTIVEVLIALAVGGVVIIGAFVAISKNIQSLQDQSEHNTATQLVISQIEDLRTSSLNNPAAAIPNCFYYSSASAKITAGNGFGDPQGSNECITDASGTEATPTTEPAYSLSITSPIGATAPITYTVTAQWLGTVGGTDTVSMEFRPL